MLSQDLPPAVGLKFCFVFGLSKMKSLSARDKANKTTHHKSFTRDGNGANKEVH